MAIPPGGLDDTLRAAELGWCSKKHAQEANRIALVCASNGSGTIFYNALDILHEKNWITQEGIDAVFEDRLRPVRWYEFWRWFKKKPPLPPGPPRIITPPVLPHDKSGD